MSTCILELAGRFLQKKSVGIVTENVVNFQINGEITGISTILSFPIHIHEMSIHIDLFNL